MKAPRLLERSVYALVILLSVIVLLLVLNAPSGFLNARVVYQGF